MSNDIAELATEAALTVTTEYARLRQEMQGIIEFVDRRSKDASIEMHERQQWRRLLVICRRAVGE